MSYKLIQTDGLSSVSSMGSTEKSINISKFHQKGDLDEVYNEVGSESSLHYVQENEKKIEPMSNINSVSAFKNITDGNNINPASVNSGQDYRRLLQNEVSFTKNNLGFSSLQENLAYSNQNSENRNSVQRSPDIYNSVFSNKNLSFRPLDKNVDSNTNPSNNLASDSEHAMQNSEIGINSYEETNDEVFELIAQSLTCMNKGLEMFSQVLPKILKQQEELNARLNDIQEQVAAATSKLYDFEKRCSEALENVYDTVRKISASGKKAYVDNSTSSTTPNPVYYFVTENFVNGLNKNTEPFSQISQLENRYKANNKRS